MNSIADKIITSVLITTWLWLSLCVKRLHPIHRFKSWRKARNARAVVRLRRQVKDLHNELNRRRRNLQAFFKDAIKRTF